MKVRARSLRRATMRLLAHDRLDWLNDHIGLDRLAQRLICLVWRHEPERQPCGMVHHDSCAWCLTPAPGRAVRGVE